MEDHISSTEGKGETGEKVNFEENFGLILISCLRDSKLQVSVVTLLILPYLTNVLLCTSKQMYFYELANVYLPLNERGLDVYEVLKFLYFVLQC